MTSLARSVESAWAETPASHLALVAGALGLVWLALRSRSRSAPAASSPSKGLRFVTPAEEKWVDYIHKNVVSKLEGSRADQARTAAVVTWWALKEGVLDVQPNPWRHNLCSATGETQIGDLGVCTSGAWQIGMSGIQGNAVSLAQVEAVAARIYPSDSIEGVLSRVADDAGVDDAAKDQITQSTGALRKAWLLRDPAISFTLQAPFVGPCLRSGGAPSWCFGNWETARAFASSPENIQETLSALEARFSESTSGGLLLPGLVALGAAGIGYAWYTGYGPFRKDR